MCYHNLNPYSIAGTTKNLVVPGVSCFFPKTPILTHVTGCLKSHLPSTGLVPNLQGLPLAATHSRARGMIGWNWRQCSCQTCYVLTQHDPTCSRTPEDQAGLVLGRMNFSNMQMRGFTENKSAVSASQNQPLWQSPQSAAIFSFAGRIYSSWPTKCLSWMANNFSRKLWSHTRRFRDVTVKVV